MMNCRGLTEIVVLNVGYSAGIIDVELFTVLVVMALVTTALTGPLLNKFSKEVRGMAYLPDSTRKQAEE